MKTPIELFQLKRTCPIVAHALNRWDIGYCDWETSLIECLEQLEATTKQIVKMANSVEPEIRKRGLKMDFPVLDYSLMPEFRPEHSALDRQAQLIQAIGHVHAIYSMAFELVSVAIGDQAPSYIPATPPATLDPEQPSS